MKLRKALACVTMCFMVLPLAGCGTSQATETKENAEAAEVTLNVFAAASMTETLTEIQEMYKEVAPNVTLVFNFDSSGTLKTQIQEGADCDVFISAAQKQMDTLQNDDQLVVDGTRHNVVNNQVVVITYKGSGTAVTGLENLKDAKSIALADGSVPVGKYTRQALVNAGILDAVDDVSTIPTDVVSQALGGVEINECGNVSAVKTQVAEGSNEVGTVYYSDTYGLGDKLEILQVVSYDLTGNVIYPIAQVQNDEADELEQKAALDFVNFVKSDAAKTIFDSYYFDTNVED